MTPRRIALHPKDLRDLQAYCQLLGYELKETDGLFTLKDPKTNKSVIVQRDHGKFIVVRDEAFSMSRFNDDIKVEEITEDISDNIIIANKLSNFIHKGTQSKLKESTNCFMKSLLEIKSLDFLKMP